MRIRELLIAFVLVGCQKVPLPKEEHPAPPAPGPNEPATPTEQAPPEPSISPAAGQPDGGPCLADAECTSGICEGQGCDASSPGACAPKTRGCTRDRREYCGCDGITLAHQDPAQATDMPTKGRAANPRLDLCYRWRAWSILIAGQRLKKSRS
jgi:hypothetical protein